MQCMHEGARHEPAVNTGSQARWPRRRAALGIGRWRAHASGCTSRRMTAQAAQLRDNVWQSASAKGHR